MSIRTELYREFAQPWWHLVLVTVVLAGSAQVAGAQSLVVNYDFEDFVACPDNYSQVSRATGWSYPSKGTADYFHVCAPTPPVLPYFPSFEVPTNLFGTQAPADAASGGEAYAGIFGLVDRQGANYVEYVQAPFKAPLDAGVAYDISFKVSLADESTLAIESLGAYLGGQVGDPSVALISVIPQIQNVGIITDKTGWTTISGTLVATGGETHITIGNFDGNTTNSVVVPGGLSPSKAYYYIDQVIVEELNPEPTGLYVVSDTNELMRVDASLPIVGNMCPAQTIGVTQTSGQVVHLIRGLAGADGKLFGITRDGAFVSVNPATAETHFLHNVVGGNPAYEFWSGLAFDHVNQFYTANTFDIQNLVRLELGVGVLETTIGLIHFGGSTTVYQMLGLAFYPPTAPAIPPTFNGVHPADTILYGANRTNDNVVVLDRNSAVFSFDMGNQTIGVNNLQAMSFHPSTGVLHIIHHHSASSNDAQLSTYDFNTETATTLCDLPFGIVETGAPGDDTYGWGGVGFLERPATSGPDALEAFKLCVTGTSTAIGWSWGIEPFIDNVEALPLNATATAMAAAFREALVSYGYTAHVDTADDTCLIVMVKTGTVLKVGTYNAAPWCTVNGNGLGCQVNPVITDFAELPPPPGTDTAVPILEVPALSSVWGTALLVALIASAGRLGLKRRNPNSA